MKKMSCLVASENKAVPRIAAMLRQTQQGRVKYLAMGQLSPHIKHGDTRRACACVCALHSLRVLPQKSTKSSRHKTQAQQKEGGRANKPHQLWQTRKRPVRNIL